MPTALQPDSTHRRGIAMLLVIVAVAMATILSLSFLSSQSTTTGIATNLQNQTRARQIAESGMLLAVQHLKSSASWRTDFANGVWLSNQSLAGGTYTLTGEDGSDGDGDGNLADDDSDPVTLTVVADYGGAMHLTKVILRGGQSAIKTNVLMVVSDASNPTSNEDAGQALIESWGYGVELISGTASQATFNAALAEADVVYVTYESSSVGTKLDAATVGVVTEDRDLYPRTGLASGGTAYSSATITVVDITHYITQTFTLGDLTIGSASLPLTRQSGTLAGGASVLANAPGSTRTLATLELGAQTHLSGVYAAGRRVGLPWGESGFKYSSLNSNGQTIMRRALEWGSQPPEGPPALAHWRLDDSSGNIAADVYGAHDGTVVGAASWSLGTVAGALSFDGTNDYVQVPHHSAFNVTNAMSITTWIRGNSWGTGSDVDTILRKGEGNPNKWQFAVKDGKATLFLEDYDDYGIKGSTVLKTGTWYHVATTWDGSKVKIYVNGVIDNGASGATRAGPIGTDSRPVYIGGRGGTTDLVHGALDDVRFYNRAITPAEIKAMYDEGKMSGKLPKLIALYTFSDVKPQPGVAGHWKLDDSAVGGGGLAAAGYFRVTGTSRIDSYDSTAGAYNPAAPSSQAVAATNSTSSGRFTMDTSSSLWGHAYCGAGGTASSVIVAHEGCISGTRLAMAANVTMTDNVAPSGLPVSLGNKSYSTNQLWVTDLNFANLTLSGSAVVTVTGNIRVHCTGNFAMASNASIVVSPGSTLTIHVAGTALIEDSARLNNDSDNPQRATVIAYGASSDITLREQAKAAATFRADRDVFIQNTAEFFGALVARRDIAISDDCRVHADTGLPNLGIADPPAADTATINPGRYRGGVVGGQAGAAGFTSTSAKFDGVNDFVEVPHHDSYLLRSGAVSLWFRTDNAALTQGLFSKDSSGYDTGGHLTISVDGGKVRARIESANAGYDLWSAPVAANTWYHVVFVFGPDGSKLYLNKALSDSKPYLGGLEGNYQPITIGADTSASANLAVTGWKNPFKGRIDDVRLYNYAVDTAQVTNLYNGANLAESTLPSSVVYDSADSGAAADLLIPDTSKVTWLAGGGLEITSSVALVSKFEARKLRDAMTLTNEVAIEVKFMPANTSQGGPAPVVFYGTSSSALNFAIAQQGNSYDLRLRTSASPGGGTPAIVKPGSLSSSSMQHLIVSYDGTNVKVYLNGKLDQTIARTGTFSTWDGSCKIAVANDVLGSLPWLGKIYRIAVYDHALNNYQASNVFEGLPPGNVTDEATKVQWYEQP